MKLVGYLSSFLLPLPILVLLNGYTLFQFIIGFLLSLLIAAIFSKEKSFDRLYELWLKYSAVTIIGAIFIYSTLLLIVFGIGYN